MIRLTSYSKLPNFTDFARRPTYKNLNPYVFTSTAQSLFETITLCFHIQDLIKTSRTKEIKNFFHLSNFNCFYLLTNHYKYIKFYIKIVNFNAKQQKVFLAQISKII